MTCSFEFIVSTIRDEVLMNRLELADVGVNPDAITTETKLMDESGLGLDSVDALDVLVAVQQIFKFEIKDIDRAFIEEKCATVGSVATYVDERVRAAELL